MAHSPRDNDELDELLRQADALLEDSDEEASYFPTPEEESRGYYPNFSNNYGQAYSQQTPPPQSGPAIPAYNTDFSGGDGRPAPRPVRRAPEPYSQEDADYYEEPAPRPASRQAPPPKKKRRKKHRLLKFCLVLLLLVGGVALWLSTIVKPPQSTRPIGTRKPGAATILLCGTDAEGTRTDTMMLLYLNAREKVVNLVSLPRDTLTYTASGNYAKLNSAFGRNDGKDDPVHGMEELMGYVADIIGYRPDGYMLISLDGFVDIVDMMGGVKFNVPQDMFYEDPSQDLYIDLKEGLQTLNGTDAMGLVRFRKGYANQDLGRVEVQREFIAACMDQWLSLKNVMKLPRVLSAVSDCTTTDLTTGNLLWVALTAWRSGISNIHTETLPGYADMVDGASCYILYEDEVADLINAVCNPYERDIQTGDLSIAG